MGRYSDLGLCGRPTPGVVCRKAGIEIAATAEIIVKHITGGLFAGFIIQHITFNGVSGQVTSMFYV